MRRLLIWIALGSLSLPATGPLLAEPPETSGSRDAAMPVAWVQRPATGRIPLRDPEDLQTNRTPTRTAERPLADTRSDTRPDAGADDPLRPITRAPVLSQPPSTEESGTAEPEAAPPASAATLSPAQEALRGRVQQCLDFHFTRYENASQRSPWGIMHALIAYGVDSQIIADGRLVNAIGWLCWNQPCRGMQLLGYSNGQLHVGLGVGLQGHEGQFLAMLAQSRVPADYELRVAGRRLTVKDLVEAEKRSCRAGTELTFKLIGLSHYLDSDATWTNDLGETWNIPKLIQEEIKQPVLTAACGGTHRMMGFAYAVKKRKQQNKPVDGQWARAEKYVQDYHQYVFTLQNPNGSFSTNWFHSRGDSGDPDRYVQTTGHILEWLVFSLPDEELADPRVIRAVEFLATLMWDQRDHNWEVGPRGHALRALVLYDQRVYGAQAGQRTDEVAARR